MPVIRIATLGLLLLSGCADNPAVVPAAGATHAVPHTAQPATAVPAPTPPSGPEIAVRTEAPPPAFALEPVTTLLPEIRVDADRPLAGDTVARAMAVTGVTFATVVSLGTVAVATPDRRTIALTVAGVDPAGFRVLSPQINADVPELWQRIVEGNAAVAHEVALTRGIALGSVLDAPGGPLGVAAFAANGQPPLADMVVDAAVAVRLGLTAPSTLLLSVAPEAWPDEVAEDLERALNLPTTLIYGKPQRTLQALPPDATVWDALAVCESSGRWDLDSGNGYYGGLQFLPSSWQLAGGTGMPHEASRDEQVYRAELLLARQGWEAWPVCSVRLGLRAPDG